MAEEQKRQLQFVSGVNCRGNPLWLPRLAAAPVVCDWPGARVVGILRRPGAVCVSGQAQGPAPTGFDAILNRRGNPPWLPGLFAAPVVCVWRGGRVVWILRGPGAICALGQAQGPAPTGFDAILNRRGNPLWLPCYPQRRRRGRRPSRFIGRIIVRDDQSFWRRLIALANNQHWADDGPGSEQHD